MGEVEATGTPPVPVSAADDWEESSTDSRPDEAKTTDKAILSVAPVEVPEGSKEPPPPNFDRANKTPRHRARSNQMAAEDVPRFQKERARRGEVERERDGYKAELETMRSRLDALERRQAETKVEAPLEAFATPKPKLEAFGTEPDPVDAWEEAVAKWRKDRDAHESKRETQQRQPQVDRQQRLDKFYDRAREFAKTTTDYNDKVTAMKGDVTPIMAAIIEGDDNGPAVVYHLATHPDDRDAIYSDTVGKPVSESTVAHTRRQLASRMSDAPTRSSASRATTKPTPRPLPLVKAQADSAGEDRQPPGDSSSLEDHISAFHQPGRGRRR